MSATTLAVILVGWLAASFAVGLFLGRFINRGMGGGERPRPPRGDAPDHD